MITHARLLEVLDYDPDNGIFTWKVATARKIWVGRSAGSPDKYGYPLIRIDNRRYSAHRLAWFYVHGEWPPLELDHINGDASDYRISNLRLATRAQNVANTKIPKHNTSGVKGVTWDAVNQKWAAQIHVSGKLIKIGRFADFSRACAERRAAAEKYFGEFARG